MEKNEKETQCSLGCIVPVEESKKIGVITLCLNHLNYLKSHLFEFLGYKMKKDFELAIRAIQQFDDTDSLNRSKLQFQNYTSEQMQQQYGESGFTCQEILNTYQKRHDDCLQAIETLKDWPD